MNKAIMFLLVTTLSACGMFKKSELDPSGVPDDIELYSQQLLQSMCPHTLFLEPFDSGAQQKFLDSVTENGTVSAEEFRIMWGMAEAEIIDANYRLQEIKMFFQDRGCDL